MIQIKDFEKLKNEILQSDLNSFKEYSYKYYKPIKNGFITNKELEEKYGNTRKGYEKFKQDNLNKNIQYSNEISLRNVYDNKTNKIIDIILEIKNNYVNEKIDNILKKYEKLFNIFCEILEVKDKETVKIYIENNTGLGYTTKESIHFKINTLESILEDYQEDEDFKRIFDKLKK